MKRKKEQHTGASAPGGDDPWAIFHAALDELNQTIATILPKARQMLAEGADRLVKSAAVPAQDLSYTPQKSSEADDTASAPETWFLDEYFVHDPANILDPWQHKNIQGLDGENGKENSEGFILIGAPFFPLPVQQQPKYSRLPCKVDDAEKISLSYTIIASPLVSCKKHSSCEKWEAEIIPDPALVADAWGTWVESSYDQSSLFLETADTAHVLADFDATLRDSPFATAKPLPPMAGDGRILTFQNLPALDKALELADRLKGLHSQHQIVEAAAWLEQFFIEQPHAKIFDALLKLCERGLTWDELKATIELRNHCIDAELCSVRRFDKTSSMWRIEQLPPAFADMLFIVRARLDFPVEDMIPISWYKEWLALKPGMAGFSSFLRFVLRRLREDTSQLALPLEPPQEELADRVDWTRRNRLADPDDAWTLRLLPSAQPGRLISSAPPKIE